MKEVSSYGCTAFNKIEGQQKKVKSDLFCGSAALWTNIQVNSFTQCLFMAG